MTSIKFPDDSEFFSNLILQRSGPFTNIGGRDALGTWFSTGEKAQLFSYLDNNDLLDRYLEETVRQYTEEVDVLVAALPPACFNRIVSIGPGNGLLELCLFQKTKPRSLLLIDIEETKLHQAGFAAQGSGYASLAATKAFLTLNGVPEEVVITCNPKSQAIPSFRFDLLMSILSMGFHYPCDDYLEFILQNQCNGAWVVVDRRNGSVDPGFETLREKLRMENRIPSSKKERVFLANTDDA